MLEWNLHKWNRRAIDLVFDKGDQGEMGDRCEEYDEVTKMEIKRERVSITKAEVHYHGVPAAFPSIEVWNIV